jgi:hypothetical protein
VAIRQPPLNPSTSCSFNVVSAKSAMISPAIQRDHLDSAHPTARNDDAAAQCEDPLA